MSYHVERKNKQTKKFSNSAKNNTAITTVDRKKLGT